MVDVLKIFLMCNGTGNAPTMTTSMTNSLQSNEEKNKILDLLGKTEENLSLQQTMNIPSDLNVIQQISTKVCNCDAIGFDINGKWHKAICTYNYFLGEKMQKVQIGQRAPFWCTLLVFTRADRQCFMSPIIVNQENQYSQHHPGIWTEMGGLNP